MIDTISIKVKGGSGGKGFISFKKGKRGSVGPPDGGDGGSGGDVIFFSDASADCNLEYFRGNKLFFAGDGKDGGSGGVTGKSGNDTLVAVPLGVAAYRVVCGEEQFVARFYGSDVRVVLAKGGRGGRGNVKFSSPSIKKPLLSEVGEECEAVDLLLRLTLLADVALIGWQNSGKSSLLKFLTNSKVEVKDYPFSTIEPLLGVVYDDILPFTIMDTPSILAGSSKGLALGMDFMRHVKESKVIVCIVDSTDVDAVDHFRCVLDELSDFDKSVLEKPLLVSLCKVDSSTEIVVDALKDRISACAMNTLGRSLDIFGLSALTGEGLGEFVGFLRNMLRNYKSDSDCSFSEEVVLMPISDVMLRVDDPIAERCGEGSYRILHKRAVRIARRSNLDDWTARVQFIGKMREIGVIKALEELGLKYGDDVLIGDWEFVWE